MVKYIQLKTKEQFKEVMKEYNSKYQDWMWDTFRGNTCYVPEGNFLISLDKALKL